VDALAGSGVEDLSMTSAEGARECLGFEGDDVVDSLLDLDMKLPHPLLSRFRGSVTVSAAAGAGSGVSSASGRLSLSSSEDSSSDDSANPLVSSSATAPGPLIPPNRFQGVLRSVFLRLRGLRLSLKVSTVSEASVRRTSSF